MNMVNFVLKKVDNRYNLTFMKSVKKRTGEFVEEPADTVYGITLDWAKNKIAHENAVVVIGERNVSLKEYMQEFYKSYDEICKSLKMTL